jgi:hypothetical protein
MLFLCLLIISLFVIGIILRLVRKEESFKEIYITKNYVMTPTELKFYRILAEEFKDYYIFAQVDLERIIQVKNNIAKYRNKIKSCSIDYVLVTKNNCKIVCCVELDDYTHNQTRRIKRDEFINSIFRETNIPLKRIKVENMNNIDTIKEVVYTTPSI